MRDVLESPGQLLQEQARESMEQFLVTTSARRVHACPRAGASARAVNALAYTVGSNIVFAPGEYQPSNQDGQRLLAHELTHVVQQRGATGSFVLAFYGGFRLAGRARSRQRCVERSSESQRAAAGSLRRRLLSISRNQADSIPASD